MPVLTIQTVNVSENSWRRERDARQFVIETRKEKKTWQRKYSWCRVEN